MKKTAGILGAAFLGLGIVFASSVLADETKPKNIEVLKNAAARGLTTEEQAEDRKNVRILGCMIDGGRKLREARMAHERMDRMRVSGAERAQMTADMVASCYKSEDYSPEQAKAFHSRLNEKYGGDKVLEIIGDRMLVLSLQPQ